MLPQYASPDAAVSKTSMLLEFWRYRAWFLGRICQKIFSREMAEDIFQEACLKFLCADVSFLYAQKANRYFCKIIDSLVVDQIVRKKPAAPIRRASA